MSLRRLDPEMSARRSASPGRLGPAPRVRGDLPPTNDSTNDACRLPLPFNKLSDLHHTALLNSKRGRLYLLDNVMYYSPNSTQDVSVPEPFPSEEKRNMLKKTMATLDEFQAPLYFHKKYRFLPYVPTVLCFDDLMCAPLRRRLEVEEDFEREDGKWVVPKDVVEEWMEIQKQTLWLITWLTSFKPLGQHSVRPPSEMGLQRKFDTVNQAAFFVRRTKNWFHMLFAAATWMLSEHHIFSTPDRENLPLWKLLIGTVDVTFLRCFVNSIAICISSHVPRVGCFFDIANYDEDPERTARQMHRFVYNSIPFWFPLTEQTLILLENPALRKFKPPPQLVRAFEEEGRNPRPVSPPAMYTQVSVVDAWRREVALEPTHLPWEMFFAVRERKQQERMATETSRDRQSRMDREKHAKVSWSGTSTYYKWELVDKDTGSRQRVKIDKDDIRQEMIRHSPAQRRFDGMANEWDICTEFGSWGDYDEKFRNYHDGDSDLESDDEGDDDRDVPPTDPGPYQVPIPGVNPLPSTDVLESPVSPAPTADREFGSDLTYHLTGKMASRLPLLYGVYFSAISSTLPSVGSAHQNVVYRAFGGESQPRPLPDVPINCLLYQLLLCMLDYEESEQLLPRAMGLCDLHPLNPDLDTVIRSTVMTRRDSDIYLISPESSTPGPTVVVYDPEAAIFCCRLEDRSFENMAKSLFRHGIRFNACLPSESVLLPPPSSEFIFAAVPPVIAPGLPLNKDVYDRFVEQRRWFLVGHRRRAALLLGGLISRIARDVIGDDAECERLILEGASENVFNCADNVIETLEDGRHLCDDVLSIMEKDYILGVHYQIDVAPDSYAYVAKSWWPRASILQKDEPSVYHWYWDDHNESWYRRYSALLSASADDFPKTKTSSKWKKDAHLISSVRRFQRGYGDLCEEILAGAFAP